MPDQNSHSMIIPTHVAIVMDGNGRWALGRGLKRADGHRAGMESLRRVVGLCYQRGIRYLTVFAFSSENWKRPADEVQGLLSLFEGVLDKESRELAQKNVRLKMVGDLSRFSFALRKMIEQAEKLTQNNTQLQLNVAINYGGRWDIVQAAQKLAEQIACQNQAQTQAQMAQGDLPPPLIWDEKNLSQHMAFNGLPDPDLFIRTGGEQRLSNFLLWQSAYSELFFSKALWPDFDEQCLDEALNFYATRERRFGMTSEQIKKSPAEN